MMEWPADSVERWPLAKLIPYARNARTHSPDQVKQIAASMREWGWTIPVLADENGGIIAGHARVMAAELNGYTEAPVMIAHGWSEAKKRAYVLADNQLAANAGWNTELLAGELRDLQASAYDISLLGFSTKELNELFAVDIPESADAVPVLPVTPVSQPGDLWLCGPHRVLCGDATDRAAVERSLGGLKPILLVTDPPYGISLDSEWRDRAGLNGGISGAQAHRTPAAKAAAKKAGNARAEPSYMKHRTQGHTETTISGDTRADWSDVFELVPSVEVAYVWHASIFTREVLNGLERIGFLYPQQIIWDKGLAALTRTHYWYRHEPCWYVRKVNAPWFGKAGENQTIWTAPSPKFMMGRKDGAEEKIDHPTQKPVRLMITSIQNHTASGDAVWEPFHGIGHHAGRVRTDRARVLRDGDRSKVRGRGREEMGADVRRDGHARW